MSLNDRLSASARRLVSHFSGGTTITIRRVTTGELQDDGSVTTSATVATAQSTYPTPFGRALRDGSRVLDGDFRVVVWKDPALTITPRSEDLVALDGKTYSVVAVDESPGAYELHLRGGGQ